MRRAVDCGKRPVSSSTSDRADKKINGEVRDNHGRRSAGMSCVMRLSVGLLVCMIVMGCLSGLFMGFASEKVKLEDSVVWERNMERIRNASGSSHTDESNTTETHTGVESEEKEETIEITENPEKAEQAEAQEVSVQTESSEMPEKTSEKPDRPKDVYRKILMPKPEPEPSDPILDTILDSIIQEGMTDEEKCRAVYDYVHMIPYADIVYSEDWQENGLQMLERRLGDCFGFYGASRLLLERLGYDVIEVHNQNGFRHVWCMVSLDHGHTWRHFDPTSWKWWDEQDICLLTDEEMSAYGDRHQVGTGLKSHDWDMGQAAVNIKLLFRKDTP